jgi:VIT1/CCC1 family predicted Fe2+/Mn2+ transporter
MSDSNFQELKELILGMNKRMELGFFEVRAEFKQVRAEIQLVEERLTGRINQVEEKLTGRINQVEEKLIGIDKRLANEELVSRGVFIALVGGVVTGLTKFFFFP